MTGAGAIADADDVLTQALRAYRLDPGLALHRAAEAGLVRASQPAGPLLEVGCHDGTFAVLALDGHVSVADRVGCDIDAGGLAQAATRFREVVQADAARLPCADGSFRTVLCNSVLAHVESLPHCLAEINRVLRADGRLIATVPTPRFHQWFAPARALRAVGLTTAASALSRRYDRKWHQRHFLDREAWKLQLSGAGLRLEHWAEYFDARGSMMWSSWFIGWRLGLGRLDAGALARRLFPAGAARTRWLERRLSGALASSAGPVAGQGGSAFIIAVPEAR